jgi:hypothetical protein
LFRAGVQICAFAIADKILQVTQAGLNLLEECLSIPAENIGKTLDPTMIQSCLKELVLRTADNNKRIRFRVEEILLMMSHHKLVGAYAVVNFL